ncbi:MAG TPA: oligosaccharide flippase family protein, partial [Chthonomonadales bacterium]|nr:oligosaccharide flippase family protein [Chthonomonadales bacterium]
MTLERLEPAVARSALRLPGSTFLRNLAETYATRVTLIVVGLATTVIVTRALGPSGRGLFALAATVTTLGIQFGNFGSHASNTYYISREPEILPSIFGNALFVSFGIGLAGVCAAAILFLAAPAAAPVSGAPLALALIAIPFGLGAMLQQNLLIAIDRVRAANLTDLLTKVGVLGILVVLLVYRGLSPSAALAAYLAGYVAAFCWTFSVVL